MKNPIHDLKGESALSVVAKLKMPDIDTIMNNPYLNRVPEVEPLLDLHTLDLLNLSQITEETQKKYKWESEIKHTKPSASHRLSKHPKKSLSC